MIRLAPSTSGAAALHDRLLVLYDGKGELKGEHALDHAASSVARFGDEWLLLVAKQKHLARVAAGTSTVPFAAGRGAIGVFGVGRDDAVAVGRGDTMELWTRDDERRWSAKGGPYCQAVVARDHVVALCEDGAIVFLARENGEALGALRLASTEPVAEWRLAHVDAGIVVLALGDWLVWVDATTRKTVRRVRARAKVLAIAADPAHVAVAVEDGFVQTFRSTSGEPRATFSAEEQGTIEAIALGAESLFTLGAQNRVHVCERQSLDVTAPSAAPVAALAARGTRFVVVDAKGGARALDTTSLEAGIVLPAGEKPLGVHVTKDETIVIAGPRVLMRLTPPWTTPRPIVLGAVPSAFAADDVYAFVGTQSGSVDVYDLGSGSQVTTYALSEDRITALARLAGPLLVVGTGALDGRVLVVDVAEAKVLSRLSPHDEAFGVTCIAADARGRIVASGSDDGSVVLLDPGKGRLLARIRVKETPVSVAFEPSGRRLACVFADGTAAIATFAAKGVTMADLGLRSATHVAWSDGLVFGFKDGHVESGDRHVGSDAARSRAT